MALTAKQQTFVDVHNGNTTEAAEIAGISRGYASRLMMDVAKRSTEPAALAVQTAIKERNKGKNDGLIADREERQEFWTKILRGELTDVVVLDGVELDCRESQLVIRMKASELLGKSELDFGERHLDETPQTLADIAALMGHRRRQIASKASNALEGTVDPRKAEECESKENEDAV